MITLVKGSVKFIGAKVYYILIVDREVNWTLPVKTEWCLAQSVFRLDRFTFTCLFVNAGIVAKLEPGINSIVVAGINYHLHAIAAIQAFIRILTSGSPAFTVFVIIWSGPNAIIL